MEKIPPFEELTFLRYDKNHEGSTVAIFKSPFLDAGPEGEVILDKTSNQKRLENLKTEHLPSAQTELALENWPE